MKCSNNVQCFHAVFLARALHVLIKILENCPISYVGIMLDAFASLLCLKLCRHNWRKPTRICCLQEMQNVPSVTTINFSSTITRIVCNDTFGPPKKVDPLVHFHLKYLDPSEIFYPPTSTKIYYQ